MSSAFSANLNQGGTFGSVLAPGGTGGGAVSSVFGRVGAVVAVAGDYTAAQVTNAVDASSSYANPPWITSFPWTKLSGAPNSGQIAVIQTPWLQTENASGFNLDNVGAIGIGAASLGGNQLLNLVSNNNAGPTAVLNNTNHNSNGTLLRFGSTGATGPMAPVWDINIDYLNSGGTDLNLVSGGTNRRLTILGNGNVGIAKTNPAYPLDITGDLNISGTYRINGTPLSTGAVSSVFSRTGAVVAVAGDYTAAQVTNAVDQSQSYSNPAWITSYAWSKITGAPAFLTDPTTTKGDLIVGTPAARLGVGADGSVLTADSPQTLGVNGAAAAGGGAVTSVFTRTGAVVAQSGDYTAAQVTNAVSVLGSYSNPAWITAIPWSILSGSPSSAQIAVIQTPWLQAVNAGNNDFLNTSRIGLGNSLTLSPMGAPQNYIQVGSETTNAAGNILICAVQPVSAQGMGCIGWVNYTNAAAEKRIAYILGQSSGTSGNSGNLLFYTANAGAPTAKLNIASSGLIQAGTSLGGIDWFNFYTNNSTGQGMMVSNSAASTGTLYFRSFGSANYIQSANANAGTSGQDLRFSSPSQSAPTTWLTIQASTGNVGIGGQTNPTQALYIGTQSLAQDARLGLSCGNGSAFRTWSAGVKYGAATTTCPNYGYTIRDENLASEPKERLTIDFNTGATILSVPTAASDAILTANDTFYVYVNEAANQLTFRVRYSTGTVKGGTIALA